MDGDDEDATNVSDQQQEEEEEAVEDEEEEVEEEEEEECTLRPPPRRAFADGKAVRRLYRELGCGDLFADPTITRSSNCGDRSGAAAPGRSELVYWAGPGKALKLVRIASLVGQRKLRKYIVRGTYIYTYTTSSTSSCCSSSVFSLLCYWNIALIYIYTTRRSSARSPPSRTTS
jgi:hypothetical protein